MKLTIALQGTDATSVKAIQATITLPVGDVITINADLAAGIIAPAASAFTVTDSKLVATGGIVVGEVSLALR